MIPPEPADLVDGEWAATPRTLALTLEDPATGQVLGAAAQTGPDRLEHALAAAAAAAGPWSARDPGQRAALLDAAADALEPVAAEIAALEAFATGVPIAQTSMLGMIVTGSFRLAAEQLRQGWLSTTMRREDGRGVEVRRLGWGPALCLVPWNAPAPMAAHKVASALAAGCPVLLKPSEYAPYGSQLLVRAVAPVLGEGGLLQLVHGDGAVGARLTGDPRVRAVSFTGGAAGGAAVALACARGLKPVQLELGGNNPLVVLPDADTGAAARAVVALLTTLNGQWCRALGRLIVPRGRQAEIVAAALELLAGLRAGDPLDPGTGYGPLVHSAHRAHVAARRDALGGTVHSATPVPDKGSFLAPALVTGAAPEHTTEEIFGPVAAVHPYDRVEEAIELANGTGYGLEGYVVGTDEEAALAVARQVRAGEVKVNGATVLSLHLFAPRPAWGASGLGEEGTAETIRFFTNAHVVGVEGAL